MSEKASAIWSTIGTAVLGLLSKLTYRWFRERSIRKKKSKEQAPNGNSVVNWLIECVVVDDDATDAALLLKLLSPDKSQQRIKVFTDSVEANDFLFREGQYADRLPLVALRIIMLDLKLRGISGIDLLRKIKSDPVLKPVPVVILSGSAREKDLMECYSLGANGFVQKSGDYAKLEQDIAAIRNFWMGANQIFIFEDSKTTSIQAKTS